MPQGEHIKLHRQRNGFRLDFHEKKRKRDARYTHSASIACPETSADWSEGAKVAWKQPSAQCTKSCMYACPDAAKPCRMVHKRSAVAKKTLGLKGKLLSKKRHAEKATMKKTIAMHQERDNKHKAEDGAPQSALPAYLLEREQVLTALNRVVTGMLDGSAT